jgi:hypothetical protein
MESNGQLHAPAALPTGRNVGTDWEWSRMGPRGSLDDFGEEKNNFLLPEFEALMLPVRTLVRHSFCATDYEIMRENTQCPNLWINVEFSFERKVLDYQILKISFMELNQKLTTTGLPNVDTRAKNGTRNISLGMRHSLLSTFVYLFCPISFSTLWRTCVYIHIWLRRHCISITFATV